MNCRYTLLWAHLPGLVACLDLLATMCVHDSVFLTCRTRVFEEHAAVEKIKTQPQKRRVQSRKTEQHVLADSLGMKAQQMHTGKRMLLGCALKQKSQQSATRQE